MHRTTMSALARISVEAADGFLGARAVEALARHAGMPEAREIADRIEANLLRIIEAARDALAEEANR